VDAEISISICTTQVEVEQPGFSSGGVVNDADCTAFLQWALPRLNMRWAGFRKVRGQVCKRLRHRVGTLGLGDLAAYRTYLEHHPPEWRVLDSFCRITISRFHRDRNVFEILGDFVLPELAQRAVREGHVRSWSAGCASGEEVYTLRVLWDLRLADRYPIVGFSLLGTDIDEALLARAAAGCYPMGSLREMPGGWIERCFEKRGDLLCVRPVHRQGIVFQQQDIRRDMPQGPFDLVLCRNLVLTYFERHLQTRVMRRLAERLSCGKYLVVGAHEILPDDVPGFQALAGCREILQWRG
jgi:chemotaxis protein methyltransferase CheR